MPLYIDLLGYKAEGVSTTDERAIVKELLADMEDHTDETLVKAIRQGLAELPGVSVWCLTVLDGGSVSIFDAKAPVGRLHRVGAHVVSSQQVVFEPPTDGQFSLPSSLGRGCAKLELASVPNALLEAHEVLADELEPADASAAVHFPTWFDSEKHLESVLTIVAPLVNNDVLTFTRIGRLFYAVELAGGRPRWAPMTPRAESGVGNEVVAHILSGKDPFPANLVRQKKDWLAMWTGDSDAEFEEALRSAKRILDAPQQSQDAREERKDLVDPVVRALASLDENSPRRAQLWDVAQWLRAGKVRAQTVEALESGDPALQDHHIERQRQLVFEELPKIVDEKVRSSGNAPWIARAIRLLDKWGAGKPDWPRDP